MGRLLSALLTWPGVLRRRSASGPAARSAA